jgi:1-deoxy-D-xylulose-5-phosphate synthase
VVMAASDEAELVHMVATAASINDGPCAFRYPRGEGVGVDLPDVGIPLEIGRGRIIREGSRVALLSLGARLQECLKAADELAIRGLSITVADARFAKPLDEALIRQLIRKHEVLITIEEGAIGGFGTHVLHFAARNNLFSDACKIRSMFLPDRFVGHASPSEQYEDAAMTSKDIIAEIFAGLGSEARLVQSRA